MLPVLKSRDLEFGSAAAALEYLENRVSRRFTVPLQNLRVDCDGTLSHGGATPIGELQHVPLTDVAAVHVDGLAGLPRSYAARIDSDLHVHSLNQLLGEQVGAATVVVEFHKEEPDNRWVAAVIPGARFGIDEQTVLRRIEARGLSAYVAVRSGTLDVRFGDAWSVEVLAGDQVQITGNLHSTHWGTGVAMRPMLETGVYLLRVVCSNGAYVSRALAEAKLLAWASRQQIERFLDEHFDRVLNFSQNALREAVARMSDTMPEDPEREHLAQLITRLAGTKAAKELLSEAVSWWDHINSITAAANRIGSPERRRRLQIEGGALIERFIVSPERRSE